MSVLSRENKRTNEQGRSGVFVFVRVRFCSVLFGLFGFVRRVRFVRTPVRSFARFQFSLFSFPFSELYNKKKVSPFGKTFSKSCLLNTASTISYTLLPDQLVR